MEEKVLDPLSAEAIEKFLKAKEASKERKSRFVCACGHSMNYHTEIGGMHVCRPTKMRCRCTNPRSVLDVEDLRQFTYTTFGYGSEHALGRGMTASVVKGKAVKWVEETPLCDSCLKVVVGSPIAVSLDTRGEIPRLVKESGQVDKLVCEECFQRWTTPSPTA